MTAEAAAMELMTPSMHEEVKRASSSEAEREQELERQEMVIQILSSHSMRREQTGGVDWRANRVCGGLHALGKNGERDAGVGEGGKDVERR